MKLKFKNQDFQTDAVNAVVDLFKGQEKTTSTFSVDIEQQQNLMNEFGVGNALLIDDKAMLTNMHSVQKRSNLPLTNDIKDKRFCIEMETGTGKTYVYTKTIFELHKRYGFTKFIIVVPSVAIREGVFKSFEITSDHFGTQYDNVPCRYFIYNSAKLSDVRQFATSANIEIMIINIDAFKKAKNIINQAQDKLNGETAMRYIQDTNPIVIVDEPQSVDNTPKAKEAIASLNPMCVLRYSATHKEKTNMLYRLTPVDAYQMGLVKQISVSSNQISGDFNKPYIKLLSVSNDNGFKAKVKIDVKDKNGKVSRKAMTVTPNKGNLFLLSGERNLYEGYTVAGIDCTPGFESVEFANAEYLKLGKVIGDVDENIVKRAQIRRTIEAHLEKELRYFDKGIKVLSLFFIDEVKKYRTEDKADGSGSGKGIYAEMFEECYNELMAKPKFAELNDRFTSDISAIHNGYFSQDKKGNYKNTKGDSLDDYDTYNTIMRDKEWLLSFDCPLRFIFSHSALKEGWDNPNVFQVCTLIEQKSTFTCRQKIGRGLRLCVNQNGDRIEDKNINVLHVMANESFAEFADTLQKEIEKETGVKFGVLQISLFSGMVYEEKHEIEKTVSSTQAQDIIHNAQFIIHNEETPIEVVKREYSKNPEKVTEILKEVTNNSELCIMNSELTYAETVTEEKTVTYDEATELLEHFKTKGYTDKNGKMKDTMKAALQSRTLDLPKKFEAARQKFETIIATADKKQPLRDASRDVTVHLNKQVMLSPEFTELWDKIKQKTVYRVEVNHDELVHRCVKAIQDMPTIPKIRLVSQTADLHIENPGISYTEREMRTTDIENDGIILPNILSILGETTLIKRSTVLEILEKSGRVKDFLNNPQKFIEQVTDIIKDHRHELAIDGIRYVKLDGEEYFAQEIFDSTELLANLDRNAVPVEHSVYDHIIYDSSTIEKPFAVALDNDPDVKMFFKIPDKFKVETPIGTYNPDWAVLFEKNGEQKLYFIIETKGSTNYFDLRTKEQLKNHCGKQHFKALDDKIELHVSANWKEFKKDI